MSTITDNLEQDPANQAVAPEIQEAPVNDSTAAEAAPAETAPTDVPAEADDVSADAVTSEDLTAPAETSIDEAKEGADTTAHKLEGEAFERVKAARDIAFAIADEGQKLLDQAKQKEKEAAKILWDAVKAEVGELSEHSVFVDKYESNNFFIIETHKCVSGVKNLLGEVLAKIKADIEK